jgi:flavin-dependent thymidylate synthase
MTAEATEPTAAATPPAAPAGPAPAAREKSAIPKNPGRRELGMKATLLFPNKEIVEQYYVPLIYTACRTCYSELTPEDIFDRATTGRIEQAKMQKLISGVIESGHGSTIEHVVFTFGISGVSRTLSHQLVRHRAGVAFDQQSQRYVTFKGASTMLPATIQDAEPGLREAYEEQIAGSMDLYGQLVGAGIPGEDARFVFPNAPFLGSVLAPKCVALGYCDEMGNRDEHCPIRPHKDNVLGAWAEKSKAAKAAGRELTVK